VPELPEVETVRRGLARHVVGRTIADVEVRQLRSIRRHIGGPVDFAERLAGQRLLGAYRRGKFLWLPFGDGRSAAGDALTVHLGMSGQLLVQPPEAPQERHLHVRIRFVDGGPELRFVDQRTFGNLALEPLVPAPDLPAAPGVAAMVPERITHIARDPLDPAFDDRRFLSRLGARRSGVKRALLDQTLISGVGNIYADEALWRARLPGERVSATIPRRRAKDLLEQIRVVLTGALAAGGTSFDALYVNINGQSGYFSRSLAVYGRAGQACLRCGTPIQRVAFMNRSSFFCPRCQRLRRVT
jgi:formamidopyrimidine-DNA glycosylase